MWTSFPTSALDSAGRVEIPASFVNEFFGEGCPDSLEKCSRITRYNRDVKTLNGKEMELFVGSARNLKLMAYLK